MVSSVLRRKAIQRAINTMLRYRPCRFFVDHTIVTTRNGGLQGEPSTYGPYTGMITAPGAANPRQVAAMAGDMTITGRWNLLTLPHVKVGYGSGAEDFIRVDGIGRFRVAAVRPVAAIIPPVGLLVGLDEEA